MLGEHGKRAAQYPQAALFTAIVGWAHDHGRLPSEVYLEYEHNPRDFLLLFAYRAFLNEEEERRMKEEKRKPPRRSE